MHGSSWSSKNIFFRSLTNDDEAADVHGVFTPAETEQVDDYEQLISGLKLYEKRVERILMGSNRGRCGLSIFKFN